MRIAVALGVVWGLFLSAHVRAQGQDSAAFDGYITPGPIHRAFFKPGDPGLARLRDAGALKRLEDYKSFVLAVFDERPIGGREALATLGVPIRDDQAVIGINGAPLDTADEAALDRLLATIPAFLRGDDLGATPSSAATLWIVQFAGPIRDAWLARLQAAGAVIVSPMATNGYVVSVEGAALPSFAAFRDDPAVQWIGAYHPFFRLAPELRALDLSSTKSESVTIQVIDLGDGPALVAELERAFPVRRQTERVLNLIDVRTSVPANLLPALAAHPFVFAIEPLPGIRKNDEVQGQIMAGNLNAGLSGPSAPGYLSWLTSKGFSSTGQFAFAVDVQDDGIDRGSTTDVSDEFKVLGLSGGLSRVAYQHNYSTDPLADSGDGHGNINASIIAGYNALVGSAWQDASGYAYGLGICPFVQVGSTKVFNNAGGSDFLNTNLARMSAAYASGARFSSNSWGYISGNTYNADSQSFDTLVRDSTVNAGNQEVSIIFSAGNDGSALNTVHPPGTAKNVITVAASENNRQTGTDGCGVGNTGANNAMDIISFSSRGPCSDLRKKPDITAPGTHIEGGASRSLSYDGGGVCNQYWPLAQTLYCWSSGTSHSCPAIAGAGALARQYFANQSWGTPSPAMVKAFLMSSARYMTGVGANDALWSNSQGMGLADLGRAFDSASRVMVDQTQILSATGQSHVVSGTVSSAATPFRVALVWTDAPGPTTGNAWVNNLDLTVTVNGTTYLGNVFVGASSVTGGVADTRNNAEFVFLPAGVTGAYTVTVNATNIAGDGVPGNADVTDQDFALLIYNGTNCSGVSITTQPSGQSACVGSPASFSVVASGAGLTYQWRKNGANLPGATASTYSIPAVVAGDAGSYDCVVTSGCSLTSNAAALTVSSAPVITLQPSGGSPCVGTSKTFSVGATGIAPISFQWRKNLANIPGATFSSYVIASVQATDAGTYDVVVTNPCGPTTSAGAALLVTIPVSIGTQPAAQAVCPGTGASFSVAASGTAPLLYQWRKNGVSIGGATSPSYSIASVVAGDAGNYSVVVSNACGSVTSANAALTLNAAPAITTQPASVTVCQTLGANFSVVATGTAPLTYQWRKNGVNIAGATSSLYSIVSTVTGDAATYSVVVTNACGTATSNGAVLTVNTAATITTQPSGLTVCQGSAAVFTVAGAGTPAPSYQWKKNGVNIGGATSAIYSIASAQPGDAANYSVLVSNGCASVMSMVAALAVNTAPAINTQPAGATLCEGAAASFSVGASGTAPLAYQWKKNGADIAGATSSTHAIASVVAGDAGTYSVVVTNGCGSAPSANAVLAVNVAPSIGSQPAGLAVCAGAGASFSVTATGTAPLSYQWRKDGAPIGGATAATYAIASTTAGAAGSYDVVVTNGCGSATSQAATLQVDQPVAITASPTAATVCEGAGASFSATATGTAPLSYQWRKDGAPIGGATAATYAIVAATAADAGGYDVVVTNGCGSTTSPAATLQVDQPVAITIPPAAATVCEGAGASFSATATGTAPLSYQWRKDGAPIGGATAATYAIVAATAADAGSYDVVVTNNCGPATSAAATLQVDQPVTITTPPAAQAVCEGAGASFSVTASGTAPLAYQWRRNGAAIAGAVAATYAIASTAAADAGTYDVVVTNGCGPATSGGAVLTVDVVPVIASGPAAATLCEGSPLAFSVTLTRSGAFAYQWQKDGSPIAGATSATYAIAAVAAADAGSYDVTVTSPCGSATSAAAAIAVDVAPSITTPPASATVCEGAPVSFTVAASGTAPLLYQWRKNGADIGGAVAPTYAIIAMTAADAGSYDVVVTNGCGSATSAAATLASDSVSITTQPAGQTVCAGDPIALSVTAAGQAPLAYQWRKNGADVAGATSSSFAIAAATGADSGSYDVVVTNACGPVTSAAAAVLVGTPAIASLSPPAIAPMAPASPSVTVAVTGSCFVPASVVYANCVALPTTFVDSAHLTCVLGPSIPQTQIPGGLCINVQNTVADVSNSAALIVGSGSSAGTIRRHPLTPAPGEAYSIVMEGAPPFAILSLFVDFGTVTPVTAFPDPITNLVLAVSPITGSAGPLLTVFDGLGVFGPATGIAFDGAGSFVIPGIILPNPPLGLAVTIQAAYLDPTSPIGLRLNWARFPEEI